MVMVLSVSLLLVFIVFTNDGLLMVKSLSNIACKTVKS